MIDLVRAARVDDYVALLVVRNKPGIWSAVQSAIQKIIGFYDWQV